MVRITVCELPDDASLLARQWAALRSHVELAESDLVVLPEMPFYPWLPTTRDVEPALWVAAVAAHDRWQARFDALAARWVVGTRPVIQAGRRLNEGFIWSVRSGYQGIHTKAYLPDEEGFWEDSWYERGDPAFRVTEVDGLRVGFLICTELWFMSHARAYAAAGVHLLMVPRATPRATVDKWIAGGRAAAVVAGAYCLSSNRAGAPHIAWGGAGWVIDPDGEVLALTDPKHRFRTIAIDPDVADRAKTTYPRYVAD